MGHWIIGGRQYSDEEYEVYKEQEEERRERVQEETWRLIRTVAEAYTRCEKYIEDNPQHPYGLKDDAEQREFKIFEKMRSNLGAANQAPRCGKVREDGTKCGSPKMKGYSYCYAHERMLQMQSQKLELPAQDDANGIQMAIMRVQKALLDDEISERKAGLLLYSLQMASHNLKHATFDHEAEEVVTEMPERPEWPGSRIIGRETQEKQISPLINTDDTDKTLLPRMKADRRGPNRDRVSGKSGNREIEKQNLTAYMIDAPSHHGEAEDSAAGGSGKSTPIWDDWDEVR